ncbi:hypothetical protein PH5382_03807 [Phaeobacter sp. CECT 5382]|uniref:hypothetical protein n=1 Tax=Phaeobacter sp. CECT 5382 TaxID=1712645 RepID=UPI0006D9EE50|nr:hypothetical protein [Phaeobacter sp. CECT 5382]CUH89854.1 hypothetical protein PH5382_03807 [Phaeobacter sp. CECT 5382]
MQKSSQFHGLSTGVKLEKQARSILKQIHAMAKADAHEFGLRHEEHSGVEPMLLALSMEFALKAWFVWDHNTLKTKRIHDLLKLFELLGDTSKERLDREFRKNVAPHHPDFLRSDYGIRDVLCQHANAFVEWRYIHEKREHGISFNFTTFVATLEMVLDEFATLYRSELISPQREVPPRT